MAHKHELQRFLFMMKDNKSSLAVDIAFLMINLETGASKLQSFTVCLLSTYNNTYIIISSVLQLQHSEEPCVEFTADQYHDIFNFKFHNQRTIYASLNNSVKNWRNKTKNCATWNQYYNKMQFNK